MTPAFVRTERLAKRYRGRAALDGVDLLAQGGLVSLLGTNGAGKTTLLRCLATVVAADDGSVSVDGLDPSREAERIEIRRRLGYLPQETGLVEGSSVFDVVDYLAVLKGERDDRRRRRAVFDVLERVGLRDRVGERVERLSGGMRRRLGLAQALLGSPSLLLLDEPGAGLDPDERLRLREILTERRATTTVFVSTHLTDEAAISDTVLVLDEGRIRFAGTPGQLAAVAAGRSWVQPGLPPPDVRASWRLTDGRHRCLGTPPPVAELVPPTLEDGYLLVRADP
jgi:ABC-2 type transport system ATP-binding protein